MCFSKEVSLFSFITGIISSYLLYSLGDVNSKITGLFLMFVSLMQGIEFLLWSNQECDETNKKISYVGMILNHLQPIVFGFLILYFNGGLQNLNTGVIILTMIIYTIKIIPYSNQFTDDLRCTIKNEDDHLLWNWNLMEFSKSVYFIFVISICVMSVFGFTDAKEGLMFSLITTTSYIGSYMLYGRENTGTMWCFYAVLIPLFTYLIKR